MNSVSVGWQSVLDSEPDGLAVSIAGMCIVFLALVLISVFIAMLPRALTLLTRFFPDSATRAAADHDRIAVAIAAALCGEEHRAGK